MSPLARLHAALLIAVLATPATADVPRITPMHPEISATDNFVWLVSLRIRNPLDVGIYTDSLIGFIEDTGAGETRMDKTHRVELNRVASHVSTISAGDSGIVNFQSPAIAEQANLRLMLYTHTGDGRAFVDSTVLRIKPGTVWRHYRSELVPVGNRKVEMVFVPAIVGREGPKPGVLLIHGHGADARRMIPSAWLIANEGYSVMLVSQPGYGQSEGPADFMGPATMRAVNAAYDRLRRSPDVDSNRVAVWGASRGATAAMLLASRRKDLRGVIAESGVYDVWATYRDTRLAGLPETIVREAGRDSAGWRARSPVMFADSIRVPVFIAHGEEDQQVPFAQAREMVARLKGPGGGRVEARFLPGRGHAISSSELTREYFDFLKRVESQQ